ncbi:hypothetical protein [Desulfurivibrio alkaliphilus]|uniref:Uncharacterized protein n=1 Tax=Desulfurivibrio alkaliphilus (strain DSM 19089 / UNIQEM U267 / AHT2) TaxID=589865 RepID=D6Z332_DESAT|nr:hypothetical protein [Desulfurivibrio alkaliphilus]ADH85957.1 hypothetical protein DaAHT2_1261 [Desulfurivibrio alkaliphilus AHT 2]
MKLSRDKTLWVTGRVAASYPQLDPATVNSLVSDTLHAGLIFDTTPASQRDDGLRTDSAHGRLDTARREAEKAVTGAYKQPSKGLTRETAKSDGKEVSSSSEAARQRMLDATTNAWQR